MDDILVRANINHSGLRRGQRYRLPASQDVLDRIASGVLQRIEPEPSVSLDPTPVTFEHEDKPAPPKTSRRRSRRQEDTTEEEE